MTLKEQMESIYGDLALEEKVGLSWWHAFLVLPVVIPLQTVGRRRWDDFDTYRIGSDE